MKAYQISDLKGYCEYSTIVFAESRGKAKAVDAILAKWTKVIAIVFMLLVVAANVVSIHF